MLCGSSEMLQPRPASTANDGRYEFRDAAPGRYTLRVERSGYLALTYGQRRPGEQTSRWRSNRQEIVRNRWRTGVRDV